MTYLNRTIQAFNTPRMQQTAVDQFLITVTFLVACALVLAVIFAIAWGLDEIRRRRQIAKHKAEDYRTWLKDWDADRNGSR